MANQTTKNVVDCLKHGDIPIPMIYQNDPKRVARIHLKMNRECIGTGVVVIENGTYTSIYEYSEDD